MVQAPLKQMPRVWMALLAAGQKDGDYTNNVASSLEYVTRQENQKRFVIRSGGYSVNLTKRVQAGNGVRNCTVAESATGRLKPDVVLVNGKEERHSEGGVLPRMARMFETRTPLC